jgi:ribose transport system permease protein
MSDSTGSAKSTLTTATAVNPRPALAGGPSEAAASEVAGQRAARSRLRSHATVFGRFGVLAAFALTFVFFAVARTDTFLVGDNLKAVVTEAAPLAILAFGLTVVLSMNDFDLSITSMAGLAGAVAVSLMSTSGTSWIVAVLVALAVGVAVGVINGGLVAYAGASSFVITLAMGTFLVGVEFAVTNQNTIFENIPLAYTELTSRQLFGFSLQVYIALAVLILVYLLMDRSEVGRYMRAIGGNKDAAHLSGINVKRLRLVGFVIVGVLAALTGILLTSQAGSTTPNMATGMLLPAFAAAFLGSAAFRPGEFNVFGTLLGVLFLGVIQNGLTLMSASTAAINMVQGGILAFAVLLTRLGRSGS